MNERPIDTMAHGALCGTCISAGLIQISTSAGFIHLATGGSFLGAFWLAITAFAIAVRFSR